MTIALREPGVYQYFYFQRDHHRDDSEAALAWFDAICAEYGLSVVQRGDLAGLPPAQEHRGIDLVFAAHDSGKDTFGWLLLMHDLWIAELILNPRQFDPARPFAELQQQCRRWQPTARFAQARAYCALLDDDCDWPPAAALAPFFPEPGQDYRCSALTPGLVLRQDSSGDYLVVSHKRDEEDLNAFLTTFFPAHLSFAAKLETELDEYDKFLQVVATYHANLPLVAELRRAFDANERNYRLIFAKRDKRKKDRLFAPRLSDISRQIRRKHAEMDAYLAQLQPESSPPVGKIPESYPAPIAWNYWMMQCSPNRATRFENLINLINLSSEYLGIVLWADYLHRQHPCPEFTALAAKKRDQPTLGNWLEIIRALAGRRDLFVPELANVYRDCGDDLLALCVFRNKHKGHGAKIHHDGDYQPLLDEGEAVLERVLRYLGFLTRYSLVKTTMVSRRRRRRQVRCSWQVLQGAYEVFPVQEMTTALTAANELLEEQEVYLLDERQQRWLPLYPLLRIEKCPGCAGRLQVGADDVHELFFYAGHHKHKVRYHSYRTGHQLELDWHPEEFTC